MDEDRLTYDSHLVNALGGAADALQLDFRIVRKDGEVRWINHFCQPIYGRTGNPLGRRGSNRDITERKLSENALAMANKKLNILNSVTRHDILNQLTVIIGYAELYHEVCRGSAKVEEYFDRLMKSARLVEHQISFSQSYQELGVKAPAWLRVRDVIMIAKAGLGEIRFVLDIDDLEIFADPLLEKVFFNLFENSLRHGENVTEIRITREFHNGNCTLSVQDDGVGIPAGEKEQIFERGVGKHTGLGLFFVRDILAITGITIREVGEPGKGARFEIVVPKEMYRFPLT
jgi:signal transduction histidine kinase